MGSVKEKTKFDDKVVENRNWFTTFFGETTNNEAGRQTTKELSDELSSLKKIESGAKKKRVTTTLTNLIPGGAAANAATELVKSYKEGDLTNANIGEKALIGIIPSLAADEFANDALNQEVGRMLNEQRDTQNILNNIQGQSLSTPMNPGQADSFLKSIGINREQALKDKILKLENGVEMIDNTKLNKLDDLQSKMTPKQQERLAEYKATVGEERRLRDGEKRFDINPDLSPYDPLNQRAVAEAPVITKLNATNKKYLSDDYIYGAGLTNQIANENRKDFVNPNNFNYTPGEENANSFKKTDEQGEDIWNDNGEGIYSKDYGNGDSNKLNLGAKEATSATGLLMNGFAAWFGANWMYVVGVALLVIAAIWYIYDNKAKPKKKTTSKKKSSSKTKTRSKTKKVQSMPNIVINLGEQVKKATDKTKKVVEDTTKKATELITPKPKDKKVKA